jgi:hypothetical protein
MAALRPDEQRMVEQYFANGGKISVLPRITQFAALQMAPAGHTGRGRSGKFSRGRQTMRDAQSVPADIDLPDPGW